MDSNLSNYRSGERKIESYYGPYSKHLAAWQEREFRLLEIGIQGGGSLRLWEKYFPHAEIVGMDIDPHCKEMAFDRAKVVIGDQCDTELLATLGEFDIIIDDGGHTMKQQQETFRFMWNKLRKGGLYVIEDLHTSYWPEFLDAPQTTVAMLKGFIDEVNIDALNSPRAKRFDRVTGIGIAALHVYPSLCIIEKA